MIFNNKRGVVKRSVVQTNPVSWISRYGSMTINQYGREFPLGGLNEAGLVIECMWLRYTEYPHADSRGELTELQWIQYQLDTAASVAEVISSDTRVRIGGRSTQPLHFLISDAGGDCAAVEFLGGGMVVHSGTKLPLPALTNNTYAYSRSFFEEVAGDETSLCFRQSDYSLKRFHWAAQGVQSWDAETCGPPVEYAYKILDKVSTDRTMFSIVYDVKQRRIYFKTQSRPEVRYLNFDRFDFTCGTPVKTLGLAMPGEGDVTSLFEDYTLEANYQLIKKSFSATDFLAGTPDAFLRLVAGYPDILPCSD